jgi:hypothetical protein
MERVAVPILRLHGTIDGLMQSMKNREKQFRRPLKDEQIDEVQRIFGALENPLG